MAEDSDNEVSEQSPPPTRKTQRVSIVEWQRIQQSALTLRNAAARYSERHKLSLVFARLAQDLQQAAPQDPQEFLAGVLSDALSLEALRPLPPPQEASEEPRPAVYLDEILADSKARYWVDELPQLWKDKCALPYTEQEIAAAAEVCNTKAEPPVGRKPKLIFQLGAAGTGKSTRMADCYETMGVTQESVVVADGDNVRESHTGLTEAFGLTKKALLDGMKAAGSPELDKYTNELEEFGDDHPIGFKDSEEWAYNDSGIIKEQFATEALAAKKDVVMGITKKSHLTKKYKAVMDEAVEAGYEVAAMATFVVPEVLVTRQVGRGKRKGRLVQTHPDCKDGNLIENAELKQQLSIDALGYMSELVKQNQGTLMLFDNTPNYFADPGSKQGPFWVQTGDQITVSYDGPPTVDGMLAHISQTIQKQKVG